jgi:predicted RNA-binding Zn-ribbon protein involved in translation (DUF1610 family)
VSPYPCSNCGQRSKGRLATSYNAWFDEQGGRICYRQRLCAPCLTLLAGYLKGSALENSSDVAACPVCGQDSSENLDPLYLMVYLPKQEAREYALTTCTSCASNLRVSLAAGGKLMPDRQGAGEGAPSPASAFEGVLE